MLSVGDTMLLLHQHSVEGVTEPLTPCYLRNHHDQHDQGDPSSAMAVGALGWGWGWGSIELRSQRLHHLGVRH